MAKSIEAVGNTDANAFEDNNMIAFNQDNDAHDASKKASGENENKKDVILKAQWPLIDKSISSFIKILGYAILLLSTSSGDL